MSNADQLEILGWMLLAAALGSIIGLEREFRGHEAGVRTSGLVCAGAAVFGLISFRVTNDDRIAAGVVQGVSFLGASLVIQRRHGDIAGVTTAATVWVVAAIGLLVAAKLWLSALGITVAVVLLLELAPVSAWIYRRGESHRNRQAPEPPANEGDGG